MRMWRYVHPASHLRYRINIRKKKSGVSYPHTDLLPAAPWDFDIFKRKIICFTGKNILHYGLFAALNTGNLIHGDKTNKQECGLASFDSGGIRQSPLPRTVAFVEYTYFLLNMCHAIHSWVMKQDEADTDSDGASDFESTFDVCRAETGSQKAGFFNVGNMRPERIPSTKTQSDGCNCGIYTSLSWSMFVAVERTNPGLWTKIETLADLDKEIVKSFWDLHQNKEDRMINFRYRICRLMEFFLDKSVVSSLATKYMYTSVDEQLNKLGSIAQENDCDLLVTKWVTRKRVGKFDLKMETSHRWALVVIPLGGDGGIGHAITIVGDLIFDSTQSHALKLGKNSLDWCCANDRGFESIYMAIKFALKKASNVSYIKVNCTFNLNCHGTLQYSLRSSLTKY
jgi:hypothetical protein